MTPPSSQKNHFRFEWADAYKGFAILFVVMIHVFGRFMGLYPERSPQWYFIGIAHGIADCAVPAFLLLSVIVNVNSLRSRRDYKRYYKNRLLTIVYPYVIWSILYYFLYISQKGFSFSLSNLIHLILIGKAYDHLYFLWVLFQIIIVLPILIPLFQKMDIWRIFLSIIVLNVAIKVILVVFLHSNLLLERSMLRYIPMILVGLYLASEPHLLTARLQRSASMIMIMTLIAGMFYIPDSIIVHNHESRLAIEMHSINRQVINPDTKQVSNNLKPIPQKITPLTTSRRVGIRAVIHAVYKSARSWFFTLSASLFLMLLMIAWTTASRLRSVFERIGEYSLQIYLFHPMVLVVLDRLQFVSAYIGKFTTMILYIVLAILVSYLFARSMERVGVSRLLFGR